MRYYLPAILRAGLFVLLFIFSVAIVLTTAQNTRTARTLAVKSLESTAFALSSSAKNALRMMGNKASDEIQEILSDRVVAYALIADRDGTVLVHTNPRLVGTRLSEQDINQSLQSETVSSRRITLGTGVPAYEFNHILHRPDGAAEMLRLVLHTAPADLIVSRANRMWWTVGAMLILLWTVGTLFERISVRHIKLHEKLERQRQLTLIGQMTAVLAHEIRNALGSVKGYAQWMEKRTLESDPKKPALKVVLQGTARIESLVNDLLCFSKDEEYHIEAIEPGRLIKESVASSVSSWGGNIELETAPGIKVMADREKLHRVIVNGINNAIEAMGGDGHLRISARTKGRRFAIRIEDTGSGIGEKEIPRLFTPFHTTKTHGTGLGLAYSKKLVEGMGGSIEISNRKHGRGAVLTIFLLKGGKQ